MPIRKIAGIVFYGLGAFYGVCLSVVIMHHSFSWWLLGAFIVTNFIGFNLYKGLPTS